MSQIDKNSLDHVDCEVWRILFLWRSNSFLFVIINIKNFIKLNIIMNSETNCFNVNFGYLCEKDKIVILAFLSDEKIITSFRKEVAITDDNKLVIQDHYDSVMKLLNEEFTNFGTQKLQK